MQNKVLAEKKILITKLPVKGSDNVPGFFNALRKPAEFARQAQVAFLLGGFNDQIQTP